MPEVAAVEIVNLSKSFGAVRALNSLSVKIRPGEFFCLLGPSGCGKTTLLRVVAGLEDPLSGRVLINGKDVTEVPPEKRNVNTVFQSYALFPHLTVFENVAFALRIRKRPPAEIKERCERIMGLVEIESLGERLPSEISGGQKQRVALARALVNEPEVLLLDEPLAAIDLKLRKQLQESLRQLQRTLGRTFLHVTHDQEEAMFLGDRIALMREGVIEQIGRPEELYNRPATRFAAQFFGACNIFRVDRVDGESAQSPFGVLRVTGPPAPLLAIRPEKVRVVRGDPGERINCFPATVRDVRFAGQTREYLAACGGEQIQIVEMNNGAAPLEPGAAVEVCFPPEDLVPIREREPALE